MVTVVAPTAASDVSSLRQLTGCAAAGFVRTETLPD
jgi:hypothetical protein